MYPCTYKWMPSADQLPKVVDRASIMRLQEAMFEANDGGDGLEDFPLTHHFAPEVYGREMLLPAGKVIIGKIHRHAHLNIILSGRAVVATEFGRKEVSAGQVFVSEPGTKRAVMALEDTRWITIHPNQSNTQDLSAIEEYVIAPSYDALGFDPQAMKLEAAK